MNAIPIDVEQAVPKYQYQCTECGEGLEIQQSFTDDALTECPVCGGRLRKVFNAVGVVFKGSGFYRNDSRSTTSSSDSASSSSSSSGSSSSSSSAGSSSSSSSAGSSSSSSSSGDSGSSSSSSSSSTPAKKSGSDSAA